MQGRGMLKEKGAEGKGDGKRGRIVKEGGWRRRKKGGGWGG